MSAFIVLLLAAGAFLIVLWPILTCGRNARLAHEADEQLRDMLIVNGALDEQMNDEALQRVIKKYGL